MKHLIMAAGLLQFCQVPAMLVAPKMLGWKEELGAMQTINRRIVQVMGAAVIMTVLGTGLVVTFGAQEMAAGTPLGLGLSWFLGVFWCYRALVQIVLYRNIWPGGFMGRASHYGLCLLFSSQSIVYLVAAIRPLMME